MKNLIKALKKIFGILILLCLFAGGISLIGYIVALFIGGETAEAMCAFIFKKYLPLVIRITSVVTLIGLITMYLEGQKSLTIKNEENN